MWKRLEKIKNNEIEFEQFDMSTLSNAIELYYKGFIEEKGLNAPEYIIRSHYLTDLVYYVEKSGYKSNPNISKKDIKKRHEMLKRLQALYIETRYGFVYVDKNEFNRAYNWGIQQRDYIKNKLNEKQNENNLEDNYENESKDR